MPITKNNFPSVAVLPLDPGARELAHTDPWRLLAEQRGLLVSWSDGAGLGDGRWGPALQGGSSIGRQLSAILEQSGQGRLLSSGPTLFRIELPSGATMQHLVPAVGGGFRGLVRAGEGTSIAGHARLLPVVGAGAAGVAMGPLIALMALSVGSEMLARYQQDKKLEAIRSGVDYLKRAADETVVAQLHSAEQALEQGTAAILDRSEIPTSIGLGAARDNLRVIKNRTVGWLDTWEEDAARLKPGSSGVDYGAMREALAGKGKGDGSGYLEFPRRVEWLYRALVLDSRAIVLTGAEAGMKNQNQGLGHLQSQLQSDLTRNAEAQERLRHLLWKLAADRVTHDWVCAWDTPDKATRLQRMLGALATAASRLPDAPPLLNESNRQVTEVLRGTDGTFRILAATQSSTRTAAPMPLHAGRP